MSNSHHPPLCFFALAGSTPSPARLKTHNPPKKLTLRCEARQTAWTFPPRQCSTLLDRRQTTTYPIAHCLPSSKASSVIPLSATYTYWIPSLATYFLHQHGSLWHLNSSCQGPLSPPKIFCTIECSFFVFYKACRLCIIHFTVSSTLSQILLSICHFSHTPFFEQNHEAS